MTTMIERVARALELNDPSAGATYEQAARAAIEAMRDPNSAMMAAGIKRLVAWEYGDRGDLDEPPFVESHAAYLAMIDAALKEDKTQ